MSNNRLPIIDAWANPAIKEMFEHVPEIERLFRQSGTSHLLTTGVSPAEMVAMMDVAGIERLLMTTWARPGISITSNDRIAEFVDEFPDRFVGVATVDLEKPVAAVRELDRAIRDLGFKALRVIPWLWNRPPNDKLYYPLYVKCIELDVPFCTQVGHTGPLMPSEPGRPIPYLDEVALTFPEPAHRRRAHRLSMDRRDDRARLEARKRAHRHQRPTCRLLPTATIALHEHLRTGQGALRHELSHAAAGKMRGTSA